MHSPALPCVAEHATDRAAVLGARSRFFSNLPFGYGVMLGCCSHTGFFMLLSGLVLQTHEVMAEAFESNRIWNKKDLQTFQATYVFSYVLCGTYLFMFLILLLTKGTMTEQVERSASYAVKPPPQASAAEAPAPMGIAPGVPQDAGYAGGGWGANYRGGNV
ncbi:hypothetical protein TSOC_013728 [Tetrabaena socialis]|uniref:Uncharacterized protein n=1 Tax=Tetrabaena socialis TaxID=47790 RepID=A0A2J7ZJL6_9CHLO|nr:hypothetical protein TSOC_013728 [Tetrabaena socialis]|eukprot:PNH00447.1 hypothetical protein TSOC_013728 [Tetrabaena socialis]